jgi:peptide/nickel transport system substrate-binding protein
MEDLDADVGLTLHRNRRYWRSAPKVERIIWQFGIPPERSVERILAGEQDLMSEDVPSGIVRHNRDALERDGQFTIEPVNSVFYITLSLGHPKLAQRAVRRAIAHAIDKHRLHETLGGLGAPADGGLFSPLSPYFQDGLAIPYDPDEARRTISAADLGDGTEIDFYGTNWTPWKEIATAICDDLSKIGLRIRPRIAAREAFVSAVARRPDGMLENQWELPYPHGSYLIDGAFTADAPCNFSHWSNPAFERLAAQARRTQDPEEHRALYRKLDRIVVRDEILWVPILYPATAQLVSRRVRGYRVPRALHPNIKLFARLSVNGSNDAAEHGAQP